MNGSKHHHTGRSCTVQDRIARGTPRDHFPPCGKRNQEKRSALAQIAPGAKTVEHFPRYLAEPAYQWHNSFHKGRRCNPLFAGRHQQRHAAKHAQPNPECIKMNSRSTTSGTFQESSINSHKTSVSRLATSACTSPFSSSGT